jgi:hypothetical protein
MFEKWTPLTQNLEQVGPEGGVIIHDDELPGVGRVTIERKTGQTAGLDHFPVTIGVCGSLVHTAFFSNQNDAQEAAEMAKLLIQVLQNVEMQ